MRKSKIAISEKFDHPKIFLIIFSSYFLLNLNSISRFSLLTFFSDSTSSVAHSEAAMQQNTIVVLRFLTNIQKGAVVLF